MAHIDYSTRTMKMKMLLPLLFSSIMAFQTAESYPKYVTSAVGASSYPSKSSNVNSHILVRRIRDSDTKKGYNTEPYLEFKSELPKELLVEENGRYMLECEVYGQPNPIIYWLKNGKVVQQQQQYGEQSPTDTMLSLMMATSSSSSQTSQIGLHRVKSRLFLDCLHPAEESAAVYTCVAATPYQQKRASTRVVFKRPLVAEDQIVNDKELEMFANQNSIERFSKSASPLPSTTIDDFFMPTVTTKMCLKKKSLDSPRIYFWTETMVEAIGNDGLIHCRSSGYPRPVIEWLQNDQPLDLSDPRYHIQASGDLFIKNVTFNDMGIYKCMARNGFGQDSIEKIFFYPIKKE